MSASHGYGEWLPLLIQCLQQQASVVRAVIAEVRGSAPREAGASMLITAGATLGTIGGGRLEWEVLRSARELLAADAPPVVLRRFVLGPELAQCCGGVVEVWLERCTREDLGQLRQLLRERASGSVEWRSTWSNAKVVERESRRRASSDAAAPVRAHLQRSGTEVTLVECLQQPATLWLYGAGHVGQAVLRIVAELPWQVTWIDSRADALAEGCRGTIQALCAPEPVSTVAQAPAGSCFLVMTHSHALDYALCRAILDRGDYSWAGLIGSHSKSARFRAQLRRDGVPAAQVERLVCPIGIAGMHDKHPTAIAVAVVAQLLQHFQQARPMSHELSSATTHCAQHCATCDGSVVPS